MRAGVVSDSHGSYERLAQAFAAMGPIDLLIHAGDGHAEATRWRREHPEIRVEMVIGNCDFLASCPEEKLFYLDRWKVLLTHGHLYGTKAGLQRLVARGRELQAALVVYGHTHQAVRLTDQGLILFNPGSLSAPRSRGRPSFGLIQTGGGQLEISHCYL